MKLFLILLLTASCKDCDEDVFTCTSAKDNCQQQLDRTTINGYSIKISNEEVAACSSVSELCNK